jgi:hypothetical protein
MIIGKAHTAIMHPVEVRGAENRVAMTGNIAVSLIIGENQNNIWFAAIFWSICFSFFTCIDARSHCQNSNGSG